MVKQIITTSGDTIQGLKRSENGAIIVSNLKEKQDYIRQKKLYERIEKLEHEVGVLINFMKELSRLH